MDSREAAAVVARRIGHLVGAWVAGHGALKEPYGGHPPGTPYVVIRADCALERELARQHVETIGGVPELAWEHGWAPVRLASGELVTELRVFPTSLRVQNAASSAA